MRQSLPLVVAPLLLLLSTTISSSQAMFIDFGNFKLDEKELQTKTRYVYSDHKENKEEPLENATAKFDMAVHQENYDFLKNDSKKFGEDYIRLYVIMGNSESLQKLQYATKENEEYLDYANLTYSYLFRPMKNDFFYYKEMDMKSDNTPDNRINGPEVGGNADGNSSFSKEDPMTLQDEQKVTQEGVYYTSYLFEVINKDKMENEMMFADKNLEMSEHDEHLKYLTQVDKNSPAMPLAPTTDSFESGKQSSKKTDGMRRNLKSHWEYKKFGTPHFDRKFLHDKFQEDYATRPRVIITGNVTFANTDGFLSAQEYQNIEINSWFLSVFAVTCAFWTFYLYLYRKQILPIHYMVSIVLYACLIEVMFTLIFYSRENSKLGDYRAFWVFIIFMEIVRSVFARVAVLITALGQSITTDSIGTEKYVPIVIVNFMYGASLLAATVMNELKQGHNISDQAVFAAELPNQIINLIIAVWIVIAFKNTLRTLNQDQQEKKKRVVLQLFVLFVLCLVAYGAVFIYDQWGRQGTSDQLWEDFAMHTSSYFIVFSILAIGTAFILRPSNPKLAETFNSYNDLSNEDKDELTGRNKYPQSASNFPNRGSELQDFNPMDPGDLANRQRIRD